MFEPSEIDIDSSCLIIKSEIRKMLYQSVLYHLPNGGGRESRQCDQK